MFSNSAIFRINVFIIVLFLFLPAIASAKTSGQKAEQGQGCRTSSLGIISDICEKGLICQIEAGALSECGSGLNELCNGVCRSITGAESKYGLGTESGFTNTSIGQTSDLKGTIANIVNIVLGFLGIVAVVIILIGGFKWMTSSGNEDQIADAKKYIVNGIIGLVIVFASWAAASFVISNLSGSVSNGTTSQSQGNVSNVSSNNDGSEGSQGNGGGLQPENSSCDSSHLNLCATEAECTALGIGGNWCALGNTSGVCQAEACVADGPDDTDGDGLADWDEQNYYCTDIDNVDTDGDIHEDGDEVSNNFPPLVAPGGSCEILFNCLIRAMQTDNQEIKDAVRYQVQVCCTRDPGQEICEGVELLNL